MLGVQPWKEGAEMCREVMDNIGVGVDFVVVGNPMGTGKIADVSVAWCRWCRGGRSIDAG